MIRWSICVLSLFVATSWTNGAAFVYRPDAIRSAPRKRAILQTQRRMVEHEHDQQQQQQQDSMPPSPDFQTLNPLTFLVPFVILSLPLVAIAIDHPVDHSILGIPIPVPDARYFVSGGLCAAVSHGITTPIDVVKTRIQSEPEVFNEGLVSATKAIVEQDGVGALLGGLGPTVVGYGIEGAMKFGLYESLKPTIAQFLPANDVAVAYLCSSVVAGAAASFLLCPMEHTRIRLVTEPTFANGLVSANVVIVVISLRYLVYLTQSIHCRYLFDFVANYVVD